MTLIRFVLFALMQLVVVEFAHAQRLGLEVRLDGRGTDYNTAAENDGYRDFYRFYLQTARLDLADTLFDGLKYRVRWRIAGREQGKMTMRDNTNGTLDMLYVTKPFADNFSVTFGKFLADMGGYEGALSGPDIYFLSEANGGTGYLNKGVHLAGADANVYYTGGKATFVEGPHSVAFHVANNNTAVGRNGSFAPDAGDTLDNGAFAQDRGYVGIVYNNTGWLGNPVLQSIMSVHYSNPGAGTDEALYLALGGQLILDTWMIQTDLLQNRYKSHVSNETYDDSTSSLAFALAKQIDELAIKLRIHLSEEKLGGAPVETNKYRGAGLIFEHQKTEGSSIRYHLVYFYRTMDPDNVDNRQRVEQDLLIGVKIKTDLFSAFVKKSEAK